MSVNSKMTALADSIRAKSGATGLLGLDAMKTSVDGIVTPDETVTYSQVNTAVKAYLDYVAAHPYTNDYSTSYVDQFAADVTNGDKPLGAIVDTSAGRLAVFDSLGAAELKTVTAGQHTIYNIAPTTDGGDYVNTDASGNIAGCGHIIPTGSLRMINCPLARNVRDLGGWACDGGTVKYGKLFRGAVPNASDRAVLVDWLGVSAVIDLRGRTEAGGARVSSLGSDVRYYLYDSYAMYSINNKPLWKQMLTDVFDCVKNGETVYFNCSMGADRAGTFAFILEALLGVSQSDLDADYELTSFYSERKRSENYQGGTSDWAHLIYAIKAFPGSTVRDKAVNFVASLGFTAAEINAFRAAMIDGTPQTVTPDVDCFTVANSLTHAHSCNSSVTATEYQTYEADITPDTGYVISSVQVLMNNADITEAAWSGEKTTLNFAVTSTLSHCSSDNTRKRIIAGQMYFANLSAETGYMLDGATISITMGGVEVSTQYYENGRISIPNVTGNIAITVTAVPQAPQNLFIKTPSKQATSTVETPEDKVYLGARMTTSFQVVENTSHDTLITRPIPASAGDVFTIETDLANGPSLNYKGFAYCYDASGNLITNIGTKDFDGTSWNWDSTYKHGTLTVRRGSLDLSATAYVRFCIGYTDIDNIGIYAG